MKIEDMNKSKLEINASLKNVLKSGTNSVLVKDITNLLFESRTQVHYWHLQTRSYAEHKALNEFYDSIVDLGDSLIECMIGVYGRPEGSYQHNIVEYKSENLIPYFKKIKKMMKDYYTVIANNGNTEICNAIDEIFSLIDKTVYLLSLK